MKKRNVRLIALMLVQVIALLVMIVRGIDKKWEIGVAGGLTIGTAVASSIYFAEPRSSRHDSNRT